MPHILNLSNIIDNPADRKIFTGTYSGFQRFDQYKYAFAKNIEEKMRNAFWNPNEISLVSDRVKFPEMPEFAQEILIMNLLFQTLMDSAQSRGLDTVLAGLTTSPEWEAVFKTQAYFEQIHSLSYSHIVREMFPDATSVFNRIGDISEITNRIQKEIATYEGLMAAKQGSDTYIENVTELLLRVYALEGLKFYVSFLVTYVINETYKSIQGFTKIIKLINFDEDMHVSVFAGLINILRKNRDEGFSEYLTSDEYKQTAGNIFFDVVQDEIGWGKFLLSHGNLPTLTGNVLEKFVEYYCNDRMKKIQLPTLYKGDRIDVIDWFETYKSINLDNVAGQETEGLAYNIGIMQDDIPEGVMDLT